MPFLGLFINLALYPCFISRFFGNLGDQVFKMTVQQYGKIDHIVSLLFAQLSNGFTFHVE